MNSFYSKIIDFSYFSLSSQVLEEFNKLADEFFADKIEKLKEICEVQNRTKLTWKDFEFLRVDSKSLLAEMTAQTSMLKATLILPNNSKLPESAATSKSNSLRKKRKNCKNLKRRYQNHDDQTIFLKHFPSSPPEHSYLNTKIKLDWKTGVAATDWGAIAKKENLDAMATELRKLEETVKEIHDEMLYLRKREEDMRNLNGAPPELK